MTRGFRSLAVLVLAASAAVAGEPPYRAVDLRDPTALERLRQGNPGHYALIGQILAELAEQPDRAESGWLQARFDARDVDLSRWLLKTSHPPRQLLRFTLDDTRYTLHVVRNDLAATPAVLQ